MELKIGKLNIMNSKRSKFLNSIVNDAKEKYKQKSLNIQVLRIDGRQFFKDEILHEIFNIYRNMYFMIVTEFESFLELDMYPKEGAPLKKGFLVKTNKRKVIRHILRYSKVEYNIISKNKAYSIIFTMLLYFNFFRDIWTWAFSVTSGDKERAYALIYLINLTVVAFYVFYFSIKRYNRANKYFYQFVYFFVLKMFTQFLDFFLFISGLILVGGIATLTVVKEIQRSKKRKYLERLISKKKDLIIGSLLWIGITFLIIYIIIFTPQDPQFYGSLIILSGFAIVVIFIVIIIIKYIRNPEAKIFANTNPLSLLCFGILSFIIMLWFFINLLLGNLN